MRARHLTVAAVALVMGCASTPKPVAPPQTPAEPPAAKQHQDPPPADPPQEHKSLSSRIPKGWARIPPSMVGAPEGIDAVFLNPARKGMIMVQFYKTGTKSAQEEAESTMKSFTSGVGGKWSTVKTTGDGNRAEASWTGKSGQGKADRGMIIVRHLPSTADTPDIMVECIGMWQVKGNAENAADLATLADSFGFR